MLLPALIAGVFIVGTIALLAIFVSRNIVRVPPDEAQVLSGRRVVVIDPETGEQTTKSHRVVSGGSAFRMPLLERMDRLPLTEMSIQIDADDLRDAGGWARSISLRVNCRLTAEEPYVERAIKRFLTMEMADIETIVRNTIESRVSNTLLTTDLSEQGVWLDIEHSLEASIRDDLDQLGVKVDTLIFNRIPVPSTADSTVNGQHASSLE